jgi:hypothetical protein
MSRLLLLLFLSYMHIKIIYNLKNNFTLNVLPGRKKMSYDKFPILKNYTLFIDSRN